MSKIKIHSGYILSGIWTYEKHGKMIFRDLGDSFITFRFENRFKKIEILEETKTKALLYITLVNDNSFTVEIPITLLPEFKTLILKPLQAKAQPTQKSWFGKLNKLEKSLLATSFVLINLFALGSFANHLSTKAFANSNKCITSVDTNLQIYAESNGLVSTCYPSNMEVDGGYCSTEGCSYSFTFKRENNALDKAQVHIFLPTGKVSSKEAEAFVTSDNGLLESNGWTIVEKATPPEHLTYPWVKKIITFADEYEMMGHILLGETMGQAIQVTVFFPAEMKDAYWSSAKPILDNLKFKRDKGLSRMYPANELLHRQSITKSIFPHNHLSTSDR